MKFVMIAMFLVLVTPIIGCVGDSEECTAPRGTYNCTWDVGEGNCPQEIINVITSAPCGIELYEESECYISFSFENVTEDEGCIITEEYTGSIGDGDIFWTTLSLEVDCPEIYCTHRFGMNF